MKPANAAAPVPPEPEWSDGDPRWVALDRCRVRYEELLAERGVHEARGLRTGRDRSERHGRLLEVRRDLTDLVGTQNAELFEQVWRAHGQ